MDPHLRRAMKKLPAYLLVCTNLVVLSCTYVLIRGPGPTENLLRSIEREGQQERGYRVVFVGRSEDCASDLLALHTLSKPAFRGRVTGLIAHVGRTADLRAVRNSVRSRGLQVDVIGLRAPPRAGPLMGYTSLPYLLILDPEGRVGFASKVPTTPIEAAEFERRLTQLTLENSTADR